jgi:hypothetical protein
LRRTLDEADLLYISTAALASALRDAGVETEMTVARLQSCADPGELAPPPPPGSRVTIGYQGTRNHRLDLEMILPALCEVLDARPHVGFDLFGSIETPTDLARFGDRVKVHPPAADYAAFLEALKGLRWDVGLAPLRSTAFNSYRTYTKWTEYTVGGSATLASQGVVYQDVIGNDAGMLVDERGWVDALISVIDDQGLRRKLIDTAQDRIRASLTLSAMEHQVLSMLRAVGVRVPSGA